LYTTTRANIHGLSQGVRYHLRNIHEKGAFTYAMGTWYTRFEMNVASRSVPEDADEYRIARC
jgi:hypothetical protein